MATDPHRPRKLPQQRRSRETVERILDAAARIFDESGYAATTNEIAAEANLSVGSLYQYFPNKDALLVALAERHVADAAAVLATELEQLRHEEPPLEVVVRRLVQLAVALNASDRLHQLLAHDAPRTPALQGAFDALMELAAGGVVHHLRRLGLGGTDPEVTARLVVHMVDAGVHHVVLAAAGTDGRDRATARLVELVEGSLHAGAPSRA